MSGPDDRPGGAGDQGEQQKAVEQQRSQMDAWSRVNRSQEQSSMEGKKSADRSQAGDWNSKSNQQKSYADQDRVYHSNATEQQQSCASIDQKRLDGMFIQDAREYNNKKGRSVDFVRRLEKTFGLRYSKESEKGQFSETLIERIVQYQETKGIPDADGKVGKNTLRSLQKDFPDVFIDHRHGTGKVGRQITSPEATETERYDFYKKVVERNYGVFRNEPHHVNIIGVRGFVDGKQVKNKFRETNDTLALVWIDGDGNKHVKEYRGSVDPGEQRDNKKGVAHIKDGSYVYKLGMHYPKGKNHTSDLKNEMGRLQTEERAVDFKKSENGKEGYTALRQKTAVTVYRDTDLKHQEGRGYIKSDEMIEYQVKSSINIHYSKRKKGNPWSAGCQVIGGAQEYNNFIGKIKKSTNTQDIPYTVIDASKL